MTRLSLCLALIAASLLPGGLNAADPVDIFNGKNLDGWTVFIRGGQEAPKDLWTVNDDGFLVCKGQPIGYIRTTDEFTNYKLIVEWKFPAEKKPGNSGVLLRVQEPDTVWPKSIEAQLQSGNAGDIWNIGQFPMQVAEDRTKGRRTLATEYNEKPLGEWNRYEITMDGGKLELKVNGKVLNTATECEEVPGYIALQSEGAEIHFRKVQLTPLGDEKK